MPFAKHACRRLSLGRRTGAGALIRWAALAALVALALPVALHAEEEPLAARFDRLLATRDYAALAARIKAAMAEPDVAPTLAWERHRFAEGAPVFVDAIYALDLLAVGRGAGDAAAGLRLREDGVMVALYTAAVIETDGVKCADPSALDARRRQFAHILAPAWAELGTLPDEAVAGLIARALTEEALRAELRAPDDYLCRGRTADIPDAIADGVTEQEPRFLPPAESTPKAAAARAALPGTLTQFAARLGQGR
jgi:hypothetical protein